MTETVEIEAAPIPYPPGEYAIVELFGHTTIVGRIQEVERFGTKMLAIEPLFNDAFLPPVLHGGASIYRLTMCSAEVAFKQQPRSEWQLPLPLRAIVPAGMLPAPAREAEMVDPGDDFDDPDDMLQRLEDRDRE